jgi:hypothetical protein
MAGLFSPHVPAGASPWRYGPQCEICDRYFRVLVRQPHHCRVCGAAVCAECSANKCEVPRYRGPQRVCDTCHEISVRIAEIDRITAATGEPAAPSLPSRRTVARTARFRSRRPPHITNGARVRDRLPVTGEEQSRLVSEARQREQERQATVEQRERLHVTQRRHEAPVSPAEAARLARELEELRQRFPEAMLAAEQHEEKSQAELRRRVGAIEEERAREKYLREKAAEDRMVLERLRTEFPEAVRAAEEHERKRQAEEDAKRVAASRGGAAAGPAAAAARFAPIDVAAPVAPAQPAARARPAAPWLTTLLLVGAFWVGILWFLDWLTGGALHRLAVGVAAVAGFRAWYKRQPPGRFVPPESWVKSTDMRACDCCFTEARVHSIYTCKRHWLCAECVVRMCQDHHIDHGDFQCQFCTQAPLQGKPAGELRVAAVNALEGMELLTPDVATRVRLHLERAALGGGARCPGCKRLNRATDLPTVACAHCAELFCRNCDVLLSNKLHKSCDAYRAARDKTGEQAAFLKREVKMCPRCNEGVCHFKNHGCHHIVPNTGCRGRPQGSAQPCGHHWCYQCGGTWQNGNCPCRACLAPGAKRLPPCRCANKFCSPDCACKPCPDCKPGHPCPHA